MPIHPQLKTIGSLLSLSVPLQVMLSQSDLTADSQWSTVQSHLSSLAPFCAVKLEEDRQQLFQDYVGDLQVPLINTLTLIRLMFGTKAPLAATHHQSCNAFASSEGQVSVSLH